jgi:hypothetical protein
MRVAHAREEDGFSESRCLCEQLACVKCISAMRSHHESPTREGRAAFGNESRWRPSVLILGAAPLEAGEAPR